MPMNNLPDLNRNILASASSPYLLQHKGNPVHWQIWSDDLVKLAEEVGKPILVSVGYSACHWCHVMEKESFSDPSVADLMNAHFINVKVDREEHPALDDYLMENLVALNGQGGWPLNIFLTEKGRPFHGGTYFPPQSRHRLPSWRDFLLFILDIYRNRRDKVELQADRLREAVDGRHARFISSMEILGSNAEHTLFDKKTKETFTRSFDRTYGGYSAAPKFLAPMMLLYSLQHHRHSEIFDHARATIHHMLNGGIWDHVGGGIARYSTDRFWKVPHFEKMLYDNAQWLENLAVLHKYAPDWRLDLAIRQQLDFLQEEMKDSVSPGYYSALDADSEGVEGKFYGWTLEQWEGARDSIPAAEEIYPIRKDANWEHGLNILYLKEDSARLLAEKAKDLEWRESYEADLSHLKKLRSPRVRPSTDNKKILSWNALLCWKWIEASLAAPERIPTEKVSAMIDWMAEKFEYFTKDVKRVGVGETYYGKAELSDVAYTARMYLAAFNKWQNQEDLNNALRLLEKMIDEFYDKEDGFFFETSEESSRFQGRVKQLFDQTMPSSNGVCAELLLILGRICGNEAWKLLGEKMLSGMYRSMQNFPSAFAYWMKVWTEQMEQPSEIVVIGPDCRKLFEELQNTLYLPQALYLVVEGEMEKLPLTINKELKDHTLIYWCSGRTCSPPFRSVEELTKWLN